MRERDLQDRWGGEDWEPEPLPATPPRPPRPFPPDARPEIADEDSTPNVIVIDLT